MKDCCHPAEGDDRSAAPTRETDRCPDCGERGRAVPELTPRSLARPEALARVGSAQGFRFCASPRCPVVWYRPADGARLTEEDASVRVGIKEGPGPHPLCYCFEHTREDLEDEVARTGASTVPAEIAAACKQGLDRCEETNPRGACCLGDVRAAVKVAVPRHEVAGTEAIDVDPSSSATNRAGWWSLAGSLGAAVLASACCWLPLAALALGASATGAGAFFERWRPWLLGFAAVTLALSFWLLFLRPRRSATCCAADGACAVPRRGVRVWNVALFAISAGLWGAAVLFPHYIGALLRDETPPTDAAVSNNARSVEIELTGLTCEGCAETVRSALLDVPGVVRAETDYERALARVWIDETARPADLVDAIEAAGYGAHTRELAHR